jgi:hypothetical protein
MLAAQLRRSEHMDAKLAGLSRAAWGVALLGATGCGGKGGSIWLIRFEAETIVSEETCSSDLTHNFLDATEPEDDTEPPLLIVVQELTQNDGAVMGQITGGDEPVLVIGTTLWLGEKDGATTTFSWDATETSSTSESGSGYTYTANLDASVLEKIKLEFSGSEATGTYTTTETVNQAWTETDEWVQADTGVAQGQIPAGQYLRVPGPGKGDTLVPAHNTATEVECAGAECSLSTVQSCEMSVKVTAIEVEAAEDDYDALGDASRPAGVPGGNGGGGDGGPPE